MKRILFHKLGSLTEHVIKLYKKCGLESSWWKDYSAQRLRNIIKRVGILLEASLALSISLTTIDLIL